VVTSLPRHAAPAQPRARSPRPDERYILYRFVTPPCSAGQTGAGTMASAAT